MSEFEKSLNTINKDIQELEIQKQGLILARLSGQELQEAIKSIESVIKSFNHE